MALKIQERYTNANPADTDYPNGSIKNSTTPSAKDGTPVDKDWLNDRIGFDEALFAEADVTPTGNPDTAGSSDRLEALKDVIKTAGLKQFALSRSTLSILITDVTELIDRQKFVSDDVVMSIEYMSGNGGGNQYFIRKAVDDASRPSEDGGSVIYLAPTISEGWYLEGIFSNGVSVEQFGAAGDLIDDALSYDWANATNDYQAIQNAIDYQASLCLPLHFNSRGYRVDSQLNPQGSGYASDGTGTYLEFWGNWSSNSPQRNCVLDFSAITDGTTAGIEYGFTSGSAFKKWTWECTGFQFENSSANCVLVKNKGAGSVLFRGCQFGRLGTPVTTGTKVGMLLSNDFAGLFTENCLMIDCFKANTITDYLVYERGAGTESFRGSGLKRCTADIESGQRLLDVGTECLPYNAPLEVDLSINSINQELIKTGTNAGFQPSFYGFINYEVFGTASGGQKLADGSAVVGFVGSISGLANSKDRSLLEDGSLIECERISRETTGSGSILGTADTVLKKFSKTYYMNGTDEPVSGSKILDKSSVFLNNGETHFSVLVKDFVGNKSSFTLNVLDGVVTPTTTLNYVGATTVPTFAVVSGELQITYDFTAATGADVIVTISNA